MSDRSESAAIRRRWITLAEVVAIAGLLISGVSVWMSWSEHRADEHDRQVEQTIAVKARSIVTLTGTSEHGGDQLALKDADHPVQSIDVRFPAALGVDPRSSILEPRIEARWFSGRILAATDKSPDKREGRLPVLIASSYWDGDKPMRDAAIYDLVWQTEGRLLRGRALRLKGILLRERSASPARLDALWAAEKPK